MLYRVALVPNLELHVSWITMCNSDGLEHIRNRPKYDFINIRTATETPKSGDPLI
jgi:hypothetical protein